MKEHISHSEKNNGRKYMKCPSCEVFQWAGNLNWCDKNGVWCNSNPAWTHWPDGYNHQREMMLAEMSHNARVQSNFEARNKFWGMKRSGEWETLTDEEKVYYTTLDDNIQKDGAF